MARNTQSYDDMWKEVLKQAKALSYYMSYSDAVIGAAKRAIGLTKYYKQACRNPNKIAAHEHRIAWLEHKIKIIELEKVLGALDE